MTGSKYSDRVHAGKILAASLTNYTNRQDVIVLALPRGGVPVAYQIANALNIPLDIFIVRKLGVPGYSELALGAMTMGGITLFNQDIISSYHISQQKINAIMAAEQQELVRRERVYCGEKDFPSLQDKTIILVDDGIATGATIRVAIKALRQLKPAKIIAAVPVAPKSFCPELKLIVDELICPLQPENFAAVGEWYDHFNQTEDDEVHQLLLMAKR